MTPGDKSFAAWIGDHAIAASTLDPNGSLDDLEPMREVVGDARVVAIGEAAHHVREFSLLRHRLLRFLVERCGFGVYAFETPALEIARHRRVDPRRTRLGHRCHQDHRATTSPWKG